MPAIDLNVTGQLDHLEALAPFTAEHPFTDRLDDGGRYHYGNGFFDYADALLAYCTIRWAQPSRIVEVGSGHSSCLILDTVDRFVTRPVECTFIEPHPERLKQLLRPDDEKHVRLIERPLQDVDFSELPVLTDRDILFIDSTHVSKIDSDVNHLFFDVLPRLQPGVLIHIHDVFFPFEYRKDWVYEGRAWNELYLLRAFLEYNSSFETLLFVDQLRRFHWERLRSVLPEAWAQMNDPMLGSSLWLRKTG